MTVATGLDEAEVRRRRAEAGPNAIPEPPRRRAWRTVAAQFADFMVLVLIGAAIVAALVGEPGDVVAILVIVLLDAALGASQELRAERAMEALRVVAPPRARVLRGGTVRTIAAVDLVPDDVVLVEAGMVVPADLVLHEAASLALDESMLTGESLPVGKRSRPAESASAPADAETVFQGTRVLAGRGTGIAVATGARTALGRIATSMHPTERLRTPLQRRLARLGQRLALVVLVLCAVIFALGVLRGEAPGTMFLTALSLAVAAIPEALPAVVTVSLALGARRLARRNALIRQLPAVETLGSVTYICTDKTGTLTQNRMDAEARPIDDRPPARRFYEALALCNDVAVHEHAPWVGDPTEVALVELAAAHGFARPPLAQLMPRLAEVPFSAERARMTTVHRAPDGRGFVAFMKGAPERVIPACATGWLERDGHERALHAAAALARDGLRVLAVATRPVDALPERIEDIELGAEFLGLVVLRDPPRLEAQAAVAACHDAGIHVVMITGDHPHTALAIARELRIADSERQVITGAALRDLSDDALAARIDAARVYARVAPEDKLRIVNALQRRGAFVAMTGDGVNDAPALRRANIGVAMGLGGTDVARESAAMVLLDDNFATIVSAVREGRRIYDNIRKFVQYVLAGNTGEIVTLLVAPLIGLPIPLLPLHILWVNLVTDGLPGLALASEPAEADLMRRPPRPPRESVFAHGLGARLALGGLLVGFVTLAVQAWAFHTGDAHWQSMTFTVLTLSQMAQLLAIRSDTASFAQHGLGANPALTGAVALTFVLQLGTLYLPVARRVFHTQPLTLAELAIALGASAVVFVVMEMEKWIRRRARGAREPLA
ncbi:MAG TPA: cation-translocating P-type ATPase [Gemmatimonadaceae bacterium]|nr:cation-translocating P-type ATPase [Gemmatimonadaceae bacterium]